MPLDAAACADVESVADERVLDAALRRAKNNLSGELGTGGCQRSQARQIRDLDMRRARAPSSLPQQAHI